MVWNLGKVFHGERQVFAFDLLPESGHRHPAFINLQQPYFEKFIVERVSEARAAGAPIDLRGRNRVETVEVLDDPTGTSRARILEALDRLREAPAPTTRR